jgi:hypothetical protein
MLAQQSPYGGAAPERELPKGCQRNEGLLSLALGHFWGSDFPHSCQTLRVLSPWVCLGNRYTVRARIATARS